MKGKRGDGLSPILSKTKGLGTGLWWKFSSSLARKNLAFGRPVALRTTSSSLHRGAPNTMPGMVRNSQLPVWPGFPFLPSSTQAE